MFLSNSAYSKITYYKPKDMTICNYHSLFKRAKIIILKVTGRKWEWFR